MKSLSCICVVTSVCGCTFQSYGPQFCAFVDQVLFIDVVFTF